MSKEKKRPRLSFKEKHEVAGQVKAGVSKQEILQKYGISDKTYRRVIARESELNNKVKRYQFLNKKSAKTSDNMVLEDALMEWFKIARDKGDPMSGPIMQEKARIFNEKLNGSQTFKASNGWLERFKKRYGIKLKGEKSSSDSSGAAEFSPILKAKIESENLKPDNMYNADESGIFWRLLMACFFALREEAEVSGRKECKDRVTALFCANSSGSHRIPLLMIGKSEIPSCLENLITENLQDVSLKNLESLGVIYTHQDNAWMDKCIFLLWYKDVFIPRVLERQKEDGITGKVILLLDSAPSHPSLEELNAINENFEVVCLPHNVTALIQPMAQGIIASTKKLYKKDLLTRLLLSEKSEGPVQFLKELDLPDFFGMLSLAWHAVESSSLQKAWKPLLSAKQGTNSKPGEEEDPLSIDNPVIVSEPESPPAVISFPHEIWDQVSELISAPGYSMKKSREYLLKWFENDDDDCGWESLSDSDIVNLVTNCRSETENPDMVQFVTCGKLEPESLDKIETRKTVSENLDVVRNSGRGSEIVTKIENIETIFENPDMVNFVTCGKLEPEIVSEMESSTTVSENSDILSLVATGGEPEIETGFKSCEIVLNSSEDVEITSSEAFYHLMKFKNWAKSRVDCLPKHLDYIRELENLTSEPKICSWT
ncbi:jerky protein homolog-like isoform X1 [Belonocnema kinseyi]|uniref:jerky protein homolog-like isoform X1 n=1 Tax=Belonocnema kinseyi TaxID=2817044 RepID=UPI00143D4F20|nr:jerky protein homolog-like isoform X1 [Belonocnema kinseyi]